MGIFDFLLNPQAQQQQPAQFDPFNNSEVGDPFASQTPQPSGGGLIGSGVGQGPMSFGPTSPASSGGSGFLSNFFGGGVAARNAQLLEANRRRFEPGGPLADVSPARRQNLLLSPRNARRLIEAREAEARLRNRPLSASARKAESVRLEDRKRLDDRHAARVKTLNDPTGPFKDMDPSTKEGLAGSPDVLKEVFEQNILGPAKLAIAQAARPPRPFEPTIEKKRAEKFAVIEETILTAGQTADQTLRSLDTIGGLLEQQRTGRLEPLRVSASEFLLDLGVKPETIPFLNLPADAGPAQALDAVTSAQRLVVLSAFKGNQTERELAFTKRVLPSLANTTLGNTLVLEVTRRTAQLDQIMRDALEDHIEAGKSPSSFGKTRRRIQRENPVWTKSMRNKIRAARVGPKAVTAEQIKAAKARGNPKRINLN